MCIAGERMLLDEDLVLPAQLPQPLPVEVWKLATSSQLLSSLRRHPPHLRLSDFYSLHSPSNIRELRSRYKGRNCHVNPGWPTIPVCLELSWLYHRKSLVPGQWDSWSRYFYLLLVNSWQKQYGKGCLNNTYFVHFS